MVFYSFYVKLLLITVSYFIQNLDNGNITKKMLFVKVIKIYLLYYLDEDV